MMKFGLLSVLAGTATAVILAGHAQAGQPLTLLADKTSMVTLNGSPSTVVIGNPSIADASLNGKQVFLHGHAFGDTSILILDAAGNVLADFDITVGNDSPNMVAVFKGGAVVSRYSYTCAPYCEAAMQPGDNNKWTDDLIDVSRNKNFFATGKSSAETTAPPAPQ